MLLQIDSRPYEAQLAQYIAQKEHDQALLDNAKIDLQRYQTLWKQDSIPEQTLATQESLVKQDQGTVDSDQALIDATQAQHHLLQHHRADQRPRRPAAGRSWAITCNRPRRHGLLVITQIQPITVIFTIPEDSIQPVLAKLKAGQPLDGRRLRPRA